MKRSRRAPFLNVSLGVHSLTAGTLTFGLMTSGWIPLGSMTAGNLHAQTCGVEQSCGVESCDGPTPLFSRTHHCSPCSNKGLLDRLDDFACRLPQLPERRQSILSAFKVELSLDIRSGKHCRASNCTTEPTCGAEPTCGTEAPCAAEPTCGVEPSCGLESEPTCGLEFPKRRHISSSPRSCKCGSSACSGCAGGIHEEIVKAPPRVPAAVPYAAQTPIPKAPVQPSPIPKVPAVKPPVPRPVDVRTLPQVDKPTVKADESPIGTAITPPDVKPIPSLPQLPVAPSVEAVPPLREVPRDLPRELPIRTPSVPKSNPESEDLKTDPFQDDARSDVKWKQRSTQPASHAAPGADESKATTENATRTYGEAFDPQAVRATLTAPKSMRMVVGRNGSPRTSPKSIVELLSERAAATQSEVVQASALVALPAAPQLQPLPPVDSLPLVSPVIETTPVNPLR